MQATPLVDKLSLEQLSDPPRMIGETDVALIRRFVSDLPENAHLLEFGPWLGGVSLELAPKGALHVVDRFLWSELNAQAYPGLLEAGESFRPLFEQIMADHGHDVTIHEESFRDFIWGGDALDFCFIDGPRQPHDLLACLKTAGPALRVGGRILVKNGLNPAYLDMVALLEVLAGQGIFEIEQTDQPRWCNIAVLRPGPAIAQLADWQLTEDCFASTPAADGMRDPWGGPFLTMARLAQLAVAGDWPSAYRHLRSMTSDPRNTYAWDAMEAALDLPEEAQLHRAVFSEMLALQNDASALSRPAYGPDKSMIWALRNYWINTADKPWWLDCFQPELIAAAQARGAMALATELGDQLKGRRVLELGPGLGLSGVACLTGGARGYLGFATDDLTREMLQVERAMQPIEYYPVAQLTEQDLGQIDLCLIHDFDRDDATHADWLTRIAPFLAPEARLFNRTARGVRALKSPVLQRR